jgi:succinyl-CoA synthetase alpha subunit
MALRDGWPNWPPLARPGSKGAEMAIWLDENSRILVQGMTGSEGTKHTRLMKASGAQIVAGVTPGKAGQEVDGIPVFNDVAAAMDATGANVSVVFVPPRFAKAAVEEAIDAAIPLAVVITEGIPVHDTAQFFQYAVNAGTTRIIGPNCPGTSAPASRTPASSRPRSPRPAASDSSPSPAP